MASSQPTRPAPLRVDFIPGTHVRYSGGGVTMEQQLMMNVTGKSFPDLMRESVSKKIGMTDSSYEQPLPPRRAAMTASGTYGDGKVVLGLASSWISRIPGSSAATEATKVFRRCSP